MPSRYASLTLISLYNINLTFLNFLLNDLLLKFFKCISKKQKKQMAKSSSGVILVNIPKYATRSALEFLSFKKIL